MFSIYDYTDELTTAITNGEDISDIIHELADQAVPVYNVDIMREWADAGAQGLGEDVGYSEYDVYHIMSVDLYVFYCNELHEYADTLVEDLEYTDE